MKHKFMILVSILSLLMLVFAGCNGGGDGDDDGTTGPTTALVISSTAFSSGAAIPVQYTCDGTNVSPPLQWSGAPEGTQSFVLIVDDPDAPGGTWVHWVLFDVPATITSLVEDASPGALPAGSSEGINDFGDLDYGGPCPPSGTHRYYFRLYALDTAALGLAAGATRDQVDQAMSGRILAQAELMGTYAR